MRFIKKTLGILYEIAIIYPAPSIFLTMISNNIFINYYLLSRKSLRSTAEKISKPSWSLFFFDFNVIEQSLLIKTIILIIILGSIILLLNRGNFLTSELEKYYINLVIVLPLIFCFLDILSQSAMALTAYIIFRGVTTLIVFSFITVIVLFRLYDYNRLLFSLILLTIITAISYYSGLKLLELLIIFSYSVIIFSFLKTKKTSNKQTKIRYYLTILLVYRDFLFLYLQELLGDANESESNFECYRRVAQVMLLAMIIIIYAIIFRDIAIATTAAIMFFAIAYTPGRVIENYYNNPSYKEIFDKQLGITLLFYNKLVNKERNEIPFVIKREFTVDSNELFSMSYDHKNQVFKFSSRGNRAIMVAGGFVAIGIVVTGGVAIVDSNNKAHIAIENSKAKYGFKTAQVHAELDIAKYGCKTAKYQAETAKYQAEEARYKAETAKSWRFWKK